MLENVCSGIAQSVSYLADSVVFFFKESVKTAVPDDGRPPRALVLTKLVE